MSAGISRRWSVFWASFCAAVCCAVWLHAAVLDLDAFVSFSILDEFGDPLPGDPTSPGALIYIVGSSNAIADPMITYGNPNTNLVAGSVTGDDVILGTVRIGDNNTSNGTFTTTVQYDPDEIEYVYIRYFNWTNPAPVTGLVWWGTSPVFQLVPTLGVARVDFAPTPSDELEVQQINNFVVIPEPTTGNLMILFLGMLGGIRARMARQKSETADGR